MEVAGETNLLIGSDHLPRLLEQVGTTIGVEAAVMRTRVAFQGHTAAVDAAEAYMVVAEHTAAMTIVMIPQSEIQPIRMTMAVVGVVSLVQK
jgi:hypothetical protein